MIDESGNKFNLSNSGLEGLNLVEGQRAEQISVDGKLISWAWALRNTRQAFQNGYKDYSVRQAIDFVPCECGCRKQIKTGETAIKISWDKPRHAPRVFANTDCQKTFHIQGLIELKRKREDYKK